MSTIPLLLAQRSAWVEKILSTKADGQHLQSVRSVMMIIGVGLALFALLVLAAYLGHRLFRRRRRGEFTTQSVPSTENKNGAKHRHRHRRRRSHHRERRNPTLQETGGLPPLRPEGELPKF